MGDLTGFALDDVASIFAPEGLGNLEETLIALFGSADGVFGRLLDQLGLGLLC